MKDNKNSKKSKKDSDDLTWDLGGNKQVKVSSFKGKWAVDIREMYEDKETGELKPGRKGTGFTSKIFSCILRFFFFYFYAYPPFHFNRYFHEL